MDKEEIIDMALFNFGMYVRQTRLKYGMSLQDLADRTNLSATFIYRIEIGTRRAYIDTRLVILLCGFNWDTNLVMGYLERIVNNVKYFKRITNFE